MFTKKILVLSLLGAALVGLTTACSADATGDTAESAAEDLTSSPGTFACTASNYCECHDATSCGALGGKCKLYCSQKDDAGNCVNGCCIVSQTVSSPSRTVTGVVSGSRLTY